MGYLPSRGDLWGTSPALQTGRQPPPAPPGDALFAGRRPLTTGRASEASTRQAGAPPGRPADRPSSRRAGPGLARMGHRGGGFIHFFHLYHFFINDALNTTHEHDNVVIAITASISIYNLRTTCTEQLVATQSMHYT